MKEGALSLRSRNIRSVNKSARVIQVEQKWRGEHPLCSFLCLGLWMHEQAGPRRVPILMPIL